MRNFRFLIAFSVLVFCGGLISAQDAKTPEQVAKNETAQLHKLLNFTDGQYRRVYKAVLSEASTLMAVRKEKKGFFKAGERPKPEFANGTKSEVRMNGGDGSGRLLEEEFDTLEELRTQENRDASRSRIEAKLKNILSDYQFVLYLRYKKADEKKADEKRNQIQSQEQSQEQSQ